MNAGDRLREWVDWFGPVRLVTSAVAVAVVCAGAWFLVRSPPPPSESALPIATASAGAATPPEVTLPIPVTTSGPPVTTASVIVVHVAGSVQQPGVYELDVGERVDDAVARAGGATVEADLSRINLAAPLADGARVYVPAEGEEVPDAVPIGGAGPGAATAGADALPAGPVDVNRASAAELESLPGVGPSTAAAIVAERDRNGPFSSFEDLERVPGIGPAKLAALAGLVTT